MICTLTQIGAMVRGTVFGLAHHYARTGAARRNYGITVTKPSMFFIMLVVFTVFSGYLQVPKILVMLIGVVLMLFGNIWRGLLSCLNISSLMNVDILHRFLVPDTAKLDPSLMLVRVFAYMLQVGIPGIVIGPTLMILIVTTIMVYLRVHKGLVLELDTPAASPQKSTKKKLAYVSAQQVINHYHKENYEQKRDPSQSCGLVYAGLFKV